MVVSGIPFKQKIIAPKIVLRAFNDDVSQDELNWHKDHEDRDVFVLSAGEGWGVQFEDKLPRRLVKNDRIVVKANEWHRVIKGDGEMQILIVKQS